MRQSISYGALLFVLVAGLLMTQCKVLKQRQQPASLEAKWLKGLDTLEMTTSATILYDNQSQRFKAKFRTNDGERVWGQFTKFGFEGARILFSRDSVQALNRLERTYYSGSISGLDALGLPAISDYDLMMSWMFGVVLQQDDFQKEDSLWLSPAGLMVKFIASDTLGVNHLEVYEPSIEQWATLQWRNVGELEGGLWAKDRSLIIQAEGLEVSLSTNSLEKKGPYDLPFEVPSSYEVIQP